MLYALSTHNRKCVKQNASYLAKNSELGSNKFEQNLSKNYSKSTKIAITACKFSKIFRESIPPDPPRAFSCFSISFKFVLSKKIRLKKCGNYTPSFKLSHYTTASSTVGYSQMTAHCKYHSRILNSTQIADTSNK